MLKYNKQFYNNEIIVNYLKKINNKKYKLIIYSKNMIILPLFVGLVWKIYNGKEFIKLKIYKDMIGYKFGEFIVTRKKIKHKQK